MKMIVLCLKANALKSKSMKKSGKISIPTLRCHYLKNAVFSLQKISFYQWFYCSQKKQGQNLPLPYLYMYRINLQSHNLPFFTLSLHLYNGNVDASNFLSEYLFRSTFLQTIHFPFSITHAPGTNSSSLFFAQNHFLYLVISVFILFFFLHF